MRRILSLGLASSILFLQLGCSDSGTGPKQAKPASLVVVSGDDQTGVVGTDLAAPLVVRVTDAGSQPLQGVEVSWSATQGGGSVSAATTTSDADGLVRVTLTLGTAAVENVAVARVEGVRTATFRARATPGEPAAIGFGRDTLHFDLVGDTIRLRPTVTDKYANPISGHEIQFASSDTAVVTVTTQGLVTSRAVGKAELRGEAGEVVAELTVITAGIELENDLLLLGAPGDSERLLLSTMDRHGDLIPGSELTWTSRDPTVAEVDDSGLVTARADGVSTIVVSGRTFTDSAIVWVGATAGPELDQIQPATLIAGSTATLTGSNFAPSTGDNQVTIAGVPAVVTAATPTELTVVVPSRSEFGCRPTQQVDVVVTVSGLRGTRQHPLATAHQIPALALGQYVSLMETEEKRCLEIPASGNEYLVSIFNTLNSVTLTADFQLRGTGSEDAAETAGATADRDAADVTVAMGVWGAPGAGGAAPRRVLSLDNHLAPATRSTFSSTPARQLNELTALAQIEALSQEQAIAEARARDLAHLEIMEKNRKLVEQLGPPRRTSADRSAEGPAFNINPGDLTEGSIISLRVPDMNSNSTCANYVSVRGRVVYAGPKAVVVEDSLAPLARTMDDRYRAIGQEFEETMLPVLEEYVGDPFAMDTALSKTGRIIMLFSPAVNRFSGVAAFVSSVDFYGRALCPSSNNTQIFYGTVPTNSSTEYTSGSVPSWYRSMRSTTIHEVKHIASFAARFAQDASRFEESWLEETTARMVEEIWGREIFGYEQFGNTDYRSSIFCEVRPSDHRCGQNALIMWKHFNGIWTYMDETATHSPIGRRTSSDASFYGSGWLLIRWALDHFADSEADFLRALVQEPNLAGVANLEARTGKSFPELLGPWSLSLYWDQPTDTSLGHPSWDIYDIFAGLRLDYPNTFPRAYPLRGWTSDFGSFDLHVPEFWAGSAVLGTLAGDRQGTQLLELLNGNGGTPAPALGIAILRVK